MFQKAVTTERAGISRMIQDPARRLQAMLDSS
jgi:hypothetical protein